MATNNKLSWAVCLSLAGVGLVASQESHAAAFQLKEKSAKAQGRAFAGSISAPGDAAVIADNPAAMRLLEGRMFQIDATVVDYSIKFNGSGSDALGRPLSGGNGGDAGDTAPVPAMYFYTPLGEKYHLGVSVTAPFGFKTEYDEQWIGRYSGIKTEIEVVDLGLSFSYDVNPYLSFGGSIFLERAKAKLRDAVDFGAVLAGAGVPGYAPTSADGHSMIDASSNEWGFTVGALFSPTQRTNIGIAYRSQVDHEPDDVDVAFDVPASARPILAASRPGWFTDTQASTSLKMPASLTASITHQVNDRWSLMADVTRTAWGKFDKVTLDFDSAQPDRDIDFGYRDSTFWSVGTEYQISTQWTVRAGFAYDQTPVTDEVRDVRVPDVSRKWLSLGASWRPSRALEYTVGYTHLFVDDPAIDIVSATGSRLRGDYEVSTDILAFSGVYRF